jgi:hypothetical protein
LEISKCLNFEIKLLPGHAKNLHRYILGRVEWSKSCSKTKDMLVPKARLKNIKISRQRLILPISHRALLGQLISMFSKQKFQIYIHFQLTIDQEGSFYMPITQNPGLHGPTVMELVMNFIWDRPFSCTFSEVVCAGKKFLDPFFWA